MKEHRAYSDDGKKITITPATRVPIYIVMSAIFLASLGTTEWFQLRSEVRGSLSVEQAQQWIDDARDLNPSIHWPRLPERSWSKASPAPMERVVHTGKGLTNSEASN